MVPALLIILFLPNKYFSLKADATSVVDNSLEDTISERELDSSSNDGSHSHRAGQAESLRQNMRMSGMDVLSRSYDSDQLNALFADEEDLRNNRLENLGMTQTTPPMDNIQAIEDETTV